MTYRPTQWRSLFVDSIVCVFIITITTSQLANAQTLYRYKQPSGNMVITDSIPPEYTKGGYEIIDSRGNVLQTIPKELSEEEKLRREQLRIEQEQLAKWDRELLARYSTIEEIENQKDRRISGIKNSIRSLKLTLENISSTITYYQAEAASNERQGEKVVEETLVSIVRLQKDKGFIEKEITRKENEKTTIDIAFDKDIARFKLIKRN